MLFRVQEGHLIYNPNSLQIHNFIHFAGMTNWPKCPWHFRLLHCWHFVNTSSEQHLEIQKGERELLWDASGFILYGDVLYLTLRKYNRIIWREASLEIRKHPALFFKSLHDKMLSRYECDWNGWGGPSFVKVCFCFCSLAWRACFPQPKDQRWSSAENGDYRCSLNRE